MAYQRILVPLDGGPRGAVALDAAERLADVWDAELEVLSLITQGDDPTRCEAAIAEQTAGLRHRSRTRVFPAFSTVANGIADRFDAGVETLIVMSTAARGRSAALLGSVAEDVLSATDAPAVVIGPHAEVPDDWPLGPMFVCTDGSAFSETIVPTASHLAKSLGLHPWVVTVAEPAAVPAGVNLKLETSYQARLAAAVEEIIDRDVDFEVLHGNNPAKAIVDYATNHQAGMIALATHGDGGLRRLALGSVAMRVVHDAHCPVLLSRP